jgi:hypothetical protein
MECQQNELNKDFLAKTPGRQRESFFFLQAWHPLRLCESHLLPNSESNGMPTERIK